MERRSNGASSPTATLEVFRYLPDQEDRPRFQRYERVFNPAQIFRRIEPLAGLPRIKIRVRPTFNYGEEPVSRAIGSNHMRFAGGVDTLRVTTDAAITYLAHETSFGLVKPVTLVLGPDEPFEAAVDPTSREFLQRTMDYWLNWVRSLAVPLEYQTEVIRAAIPEIVTSDRRDHDMFQIHPAHRCGDPLRFVFFESKWFRRRHSAKPARARATVASDHESRGALAPAFPSVRTLRALANRVQPQIGNERLG